mmetsp:Transcript_12634/g.26650  ORF Transcript_12634/g.26650 Transcript_12634/m.26650 type:complete len:218 (+) Transcript_12634:350-1003(+)
MATPRTGKKGWRISREEVIDYGPQGSHSRSSSPTKLNFSSLRSWKLVEKQTKMEELADIVKAASLQKGQQEAQADVEQWFDEERSEAQDELARRLTEQEQQVEGQIAMQLEQRINRHEAYRLALQQQATRTTMSKARHMLESIQKQQCTACVRPKLMELLPDFFESSSLSQADAVHHAACPLAHLPRAAASPRRRCHHPSRRQGSETPEQWAAKNAT